MKIGELVEAYVSYRKSLGEKCRTNGCTLCAFARHVGIDVELHDVSGEQCREFLLHPKGVVTGGWFVKRSALRGFFAWAVARRYVDVSPLPDESPRPVEHIRPYIYTNEELTRLFSSAKDAWTNGLSFSPECARMILVTTYTLGLRISETLGLKAGDIDLSRSYARIVGTKFHKSRIVPFNRQVASEIASFLATRQVGRRHVESDEPLFANKKGKLVDISAFRNYFRKVRAAAGIHGTSDAIYKPRIHDLRHTFAVHRLTEWYRQGKDVQQLLPALSTFLGHTNTANTSVYLTMTSSLLGKAGDRFERYAVVEGANDDTP